MKKRLLSIVLSAAMAAGMCGTGTSVTADDSAEQNEQGTHRYQRFDLGMTWDEADAYCRAQGGHLATVTSEGEQALIEDLLESGSKNHYWLGGQLSSRKLTWITGETVEYTHWAGGQPDNYFGDEDSLVISREPVGSIIKPFDWHDLNRSGESDNSFRDLFGKENIGFICEWEGQEEQGTHRYQRFDLGMTWDEADAYCRAQGGHLATVTSEGEQALIEDLLESGSKNHYWLGGQLSSRKLTWITGETVEYTHWAGGQPDNYFGDEDSLVISREPVGSIIKPFDWHDLNRSGESDNSFRDLFGKENIGFICEWEGQEEQGTHRYQRFDLGMTWDEADAYCRAQGGHLATVTSEGEQALIEDLLESGSKNHYWLGGQLSSRKLTWITGETVEYTHWAGGQPDNYFGDEDSLVISREPVGSIIKPFDWHDLNRSGESDNSFRDLFGKENIGFICEWEGTEETPQVTTAAAPETTAAAATTTTAESTAAAVTTASETTAAEVPAETTTEAVTTTALPAVRSAFETIEAETADQIYGLTVHEQAEDLTVLGYISNGNYAVYQNLDFGDGAQYFSMTANASASSASGGTAELHLDSADGKLIGSIDVPLTGSTADDWLIYYPFTVKITPTEGIHDLYIVFRNDSPDYVMNADKFVFSKEPQQTLRRGDVNADGSIDLKDVTVLRRYLTGGWNVIINEANSDVNRDGSIDLKDVTILRRYLAGGWGITL